MKCFLCQADVPVHAKYLEGAWILACTLCDFRVDDQGEVLDVQACPETGPIVLSHGLARLNTLPIECGFRRVRKHELHSNERTNEEMPNWVKS